MKTFCFLILLFCLTTTSSVFAEALKYDVVVNLTGTLISGNGQTPDEQPVTFPAIKLDQPIDVIADPGDQFTQTEKGMELLHLVLNDDQMNTFKSMKGEKVVLTGTLFHSDNGNHQTKVLLQVQNIKGVTVSQETVPSNTTATSGTVSDTAAATPVPKSESNQNSRITLAVVVILIINLIAALILHGSGRLTIYRDYTDAALTFAGVLFPLLVWGVASLAKLSPAVESTVTLASAIVAVFFIFRSTYVHNSSPFFVIIALLAKLTAIALYAIFIIGNKKAGSQRDGESDVGYQVRKSHEDLKSTIFMVIYTALFLLLTRAMTRLRYFAPLSEHVSLTFTKIPIELMMEEADEGV